MRLAETPRAENEACEAVLFEMRSFLAQNAAPEVALRLLDEAAGRIALRRLLAPRDDAPTQSAPDPEADHA